MAAPNLRLDTVGGSSLMQDGTRREASRGFAVDNMDPTLPAAALLFAVQSLPDMPALNSPHPFDANLLFTRIEVSGNADIGAEAVVGRLVYTTFAAMVLTQYVITRSTRTITETGNLLPDGTPIGASYVGGGSTPMVPYDYIPMSFRRPCTTLVAEGLKYGEPNYTAANYVGYVNSAAWQGRPAGHWLVEEFTTSFSPYQGYHTYRCVVMANINGRDWSQTGILRHSVTGKFISYPTMKDDIVACLALPYAYGRIGGTAYAGKGFIRVGGYPTVPFTSIGL